MTITALRASDGTTFSTTTWSSGGYSLGLPTGTRHGTALRVDRPVLDRLLALPE